MKAYDRLFKCILEDASFKRIYGFHKKDIEEVLRRLALLCQDKDLSITWMKFVESTWLDKNKPEVEIEEEEFRPPTRPDYYPIWVSASKVRGQTRYEHVLSSDHIFTSGDYRCPHCIEGRIYPHKGQKCNRCKAECIFTDTFTRSILSFKE